MAGSSSTTAAPAWPALRPVGGRGGGGWRGCRGKGELGGDLCVCVCGGVAVCLGMAGCPCLGLCLLLQRCQFMAGSARMRFLMEGSFLPEGGGGLACPSQPSLSGTWSRLVWLVTDGQLPPVPVG